MKSGRSRLDVTGFSSAPNHDPIDIDKVMPFNATLLQFSINYNGGDPDPADVLTVWKVDGNNPNIAPIFRVFNVGVDQTSIILCNERFELLKGQHFRVTAGNGADRDIGFEAIFEEGG